jgi:DNA-binding MarR family transcriptional regulator
VDFRTSAAHLRSGAARDKEDKEVEEIILALERLEQSCGIRAIHNELRIVSLLYRESELPSLEIHSRTRRSLSGHSNDLRRLVEIGVLEVTEDGSDLRKRLYRLTPKARVLISEVAAKAAGHPQCQSIGIEN